MELKEFIKNTLVDIIDGISEAQKEIDNRKVLASINPKLIGEFQGSNSLVLCTKSGTEKNEFASIINFDIAVTINTGTKTSGNMTGKIVVIEAKTMGESRNSKESESRIQFQIPVKLPIATK